MTRKGFTLIELLIVVAIIAILAAIAVPNFLEAQTRSKVSRAKADMRSLGTALEAYRVDTNKVPPGYMTLRQAGIITDIRHRVPFAMSFLTTPVAFMSSIPLDPFPDKLARVDEFRGGIPYMYDDYLPHPDVTSWATAPHSSYPHHPYRDYGLAHLQGYTWSLHSSGPTQRSVEWAARVLVHRNPATNDPTFVYEAYDPTNGTVSQGIILYSNKGFHTEGNKALIN